MGLQVMSVTALILVRSRHGTDSVYRNRLQPCCCSTLCDVPRLSGKDVHLASARPEGVPHPPGTPLHPEGRGVRGGGGRGGEGGGGGCSQG